MNDEQKNGRSLFEFIIHRSSFVIRFAQERIRTSNAPVGNPGLQSGAARRLRGLRVTPQSHLTKKPGRRDRGCCFIRVVRITYPAASKQPRSLR